MCIRDSPRIFRVTGANQNARKLLSTDLVNTNIIYSLFDQPCIISFLFHHNCCSDPLQEFTVSFICYVLFLLTNFNLLFSIKIIYCRIVPQFSSFSQSVLKTEGKSESFVMVISSPFNINEN